MIDLAAAGLSLAAMGDHPMIFYRITRAFMVVFGSILAWQMTVLDAPLWTIAVFTGIAILFLPIITPPRALWKVLNPLIAAVYFSHAVWTALHASGWVVP